MENLIFIIDKVAGSIRRYQDFEILFDSHEGVRNAVGTLYCDLICLCTRVVRFHAKSFRYAFASFDKEFGPISDAIDLHGVEVERAANAAHMKESKVAREQMSVEKQGTYKHIDVLSAPSLTWAAIAQVLHQLLCWLSPSTAEDDLRIHGENYMSGSCDWAIASTKFNDWFNDTTNAKNSLQIIGRPGSGKSTLATFLVQHLSRSTSPVLYFFCNRSDSEKRKTIYVIRTLLAQLLKIDSHLASHILPQYQDSGRTFADSYMIVFNVLRTVMTQYQNRALYIVIDAVDECIDAFEAWNGLLFQLQSCLQGTKTKLMITRRDMHDRNEFSRGSESWSASHELIMRPTSASQYIHEYIQRRVHKIDTVADTNIETKIVRQISQASDGLWLYARLMIDEVERAPSQEIVEKRLNSLPHGLSDLYTQIVQSCETRMTEDQRKFAKYLYIWLDVNDYMPDFLSENFDRLPYCTLQLIFRFVNGGSEVYNAASLARELGTPLIRVHELDSTYEVDFVHHSAYQYLAQCSKESFRETEVSEPPQILKPLKLKQFYRGVTAIWYFTECADSSQQLADLRDTSKLGDFFGSNSIGSYFEMDYGLWNAFMADTFPKELSERELIEAEDLLLQLTDFLRSDKALRWFEMATIINYSGNYMQLLDNVNEASSATRHASSLSNTIFQNFNYQRKTFFGWWGFILGRTTPWRAKRGYNIPTDEPPSLQTDALARKMTQIAKHWGSISFADGRGRIAKDDRYLEQNRKRVVCVHCSRAMPSGFYDKHLHYACKFITKAHQESSRKEAWDSFVKKVGA